MRRRLFWVAVAGAVALLVTGTLLAVRGYERTAGPDGAVRGYFAALARGDSAAALAFGDVPEGPHTLLTADVLASQQRIAPLRDLQVLATHRQGSRAAVVVRYVLGYPGSPQTINSRVPVHRHGDGWRLDAVAVPTSFDVDRALQRATVVGAGVPDGDTLMFPGAVPISFDTPYLQLNAAEDSVSFGQPPGIRVYVEVSPAGKQAVLAVVQRVLTACLGGHGDASCPLPNERYVPGSIRGSVVGSLADQVDVSLDDGTAGVLVVKGDVAVDASGYQRLTFLNRSTSGHGRIELSLHARAYAVRPLKLVWSGS